MRTKDAIRKLLDQLPDDCSLEDVLYHVYALVKIEAGDRDAREGRVISHDQLMSDLFDRWAAADE